jgi:hypothetical protein
MATVTHARNSFQAIRGERKEIAFTVRVAQSATATAVDITGWTFAWKIKAEEDDADPSLTPNATVTITDATAGELTVAIPKADLEAIEVGDYWHSLFRTNAGAEKCLSKGPFSIEDSAQS